MSDEEWKRATHASLTELYALFFWYGMRYAYKHKTYNCRSFSNSLYGRTRPLMSNLYEIMIRYQISYRLLMSNLYEI